MAYGVVMLKIFSGRATLAGTRIKKQRSRRKPASAKTRAGLARRLHHQHTTEPVGIVTTLGHIVEARRGEQEVGRVVEPRRPAQHRVFLFRIIPILAPLPY